MNVIWDGNHKNIKFPPSIILFSIIVCIFATAI